jgi:hypothetical protein
MRTVDVEVHQALREEGATRWPALRRSAFDRAQLLLNLAH